MQRFFLPMKQGAHLVIDHERSMLPSAAAARAEAAEAAREICAEAITIGEDVAADALIVADESGQQATFVPVADGFSKQMRMLKGRDADAPAAEHPHLNAALLDKVSMMIMRPPQHGHGFGRTRG